MKMVWDVFKFCLDIYPQIQVNLYNKNIFTDMINLKKLIGEVSLGLNGFSKKIYGKFDPKLKVNDKEKKYYIKEKDLIASIIAVIYIAKGYDPVFNIEDL